MNKIFKVVWNRTIGSFVVTSELAKGRVKSSSEGAEGDVRASEEGRLKTLFRLTALSAALLGFSEGAWAEITEKTKTNGAILAIGDGSTSANGTGALAIGNNAQAKTNGALAIGPNSTNTTIANGNNAIAIGVNLQTTGQKAIGIGTDTTVNGTGAIAIGNNDSSRMANQGVNGNGAIGVGSNLTARGNNAIAVGTESQATANHSIAIGTGTRAMGEDSIAIGRSEGIKWTRANNKQSVAIGWTAQATGATQAVAIGPDAVASGTQSTSIGNNTRAEGDSSIAIGGDDWDIVRNKTVAAAKNKPVHQVFQELTGMEMAADQPRNSFKGTSSADAAVAVGVKAYADGVLSTAFGSGTSATGVGAAAFGVGATASQDKSVAIGAGSHTRTNATAVTTATVNDITYSGFAGTTHITSGSQVSFGSEGYERQLKHVAPGAITATSTDAINGSQLYALHAGSGNIAKAVADALGGGATVSTDPTNRQGTVTLPSYDVFKGSDTPNTAGNGTVKFNTTSKNVAGALTNLNTYVNQGFVVKDNGGENKGIVTPGESVQFADGNVTTVTVDTEANGNTKIKYDVKVDDKTIKVVDGKLTGTSQTHFYSVNSTDQTKANYNNDGATGENAIAAGPEARAAASNAVVIGSKAAVEAAAGSDSTINGDTTGEGSVAVGSLSKANGKNATAIGQKANAYGQNSFAGGQDTESSGKSSVAVGDGSRATDDSTTAVGPYAKAEQAGASAFGFSAYAKKTGSVAVGRQAQALNLNAVSVGNESKAKGEDTVAIGNGADAVQNRAMAIGKGAFANDADTIAFGAGTKADKRYAIAIGSGNNAWKEDSIAFGRAANADGAASLALGLSSHTREANAIALGNNANADDTNSIAIGTNSKADQAAAIAIGNNVKAKKYSSVVIGEDAESNNSRSVVIGYRASATNPAMAASGQDTNQTVAIGAYANAYGDQSTAIGNNVDAKGNSSIAIGADDWDTVAVKTVDGTGGKTVKEVYQDYTGDVMVTGSYTHTTSSEAAVAIGTKSQAIGQLSTAFGTGTIAEGVASAAFGMGAKATKGNSVAIGAGSTTTTNAIEVNEAKVNDLKYSGFAGGNHITSGDQVSFGSSGYERQLKNVAPGEISNTSTDAINGSQLYAVQNVLGNTAKTVKNVLGSNAQLAEDGSITMNNIGGTGENTVDRAIASLKTSAFKSFQLDTAVATGTNGRAENHSSQEITSGSTLRLEAGKNIHLHQSGTTVSINTVDNPEFTGVVTAKGGLNMSGNRITNLGQGTDTNDAVNVGQLQDAMNNLRVNTLTTVSNDAPFSYIDKDGKLLTRKVKEVGGQKVVSFTYVDGGAEYNGDVTIAALNAKDPQTSVPTIVGNVKSGIKDNDAVNVSQLKKIAEALGTQVGTDGSVSMPTYAVVSDSPATSSVVNYNTVGDALSALNRAVNSPLNFTGDVGNQFNRKLGSTVAVKGGQTDQTKLSDNNIGVVSDDQNHTLNVKLAKELTGLTSAAFSDGVTAGGTTVNGSGVTIGSGSNPVKLTAGGLSNGGHKITNIADGEADNDAASYKQVKAAKTEVQKGTNVASVTKTDDADGHAIYTVNAKGTVVSASGADNGLKLTPSEDTTTNVTTYNLDLSDKTKESLKKADSALQNIGVQVNGTAAKMLNQADSILNFVDGTGTTAENKNGTVAFNVNKSTLTAGTGGVISADTAGDAFATATDVANAINKAVADSEKISIVAAGDNTHVASQVTGNQTLYTVHADKTTVSVKADGKLALNPTETTSSNQTKTTNYELDLTDAAKAEIQKGVDAKDIVDTKGITFNGDSGSPVTKKLDETLAIKGDDKNVVTEAGTDGIKVKLKDDITLTSVTAETLKAGDSELTTTGLTTPKVTAGDSVLTTDGLTIANGANPVSLTKSGLNNGGNKIANVAKGTDDTDGVNVSQIKPLATALNTTVGADGSIAEPNFTVNHADGTAGTPVHTVQDALNEVGKELNKGLKIAADNGDADKVNLGETVTYTSKDKNIVTTVANNEIDFSLADKITVGKAGQKPVVIDGTTGTVSGLTNKTLGGADFATKGQAATEEQLNETQVNLKNILGGNAANNNGNVTTNNIGETGADNVHDAIKSVKETAEKGWKLKANDEADSDSEKIAAGDTVTVKQGKNIRVKRSGKDLTVETSDDVEFDHVKADSVAATSVVAESVIAGNSVLTTDGLKIGADGSPSQVSLTTSGLNNGGNKIANVAKGVADTDAVNVSQLNPIAKALNSSINPITGAIEAPVFTVTKADGTKHDAVGTVQDALDKVGEEVSKGLNIVADNGSSEKVNLGDTVTYTSKDKNIVTTSGTGKAIDFSLAEKVTIGKDAANGGKPVAIDGKEGIVSGLTNTTLGSAPLAGSNKAATEAQLDATQVNLKTILGGEAKNENGNVSTANIGGTGKDNVHDAIAAVKETVGKGWNLKANDEADSEKIAAGDTVTVKQGKNIRVKRSGKELTIETEDDVEFGTVSATTVLADSFISGNSVLSGEGLKIGADGSPSQVSLTNAGLNNGGNKIANVAKGTDDTDAVNVAQLNEQLAATEKTTTVVAGKNVTVSEKVDGNNTEYTVNADKTTLSQAANGAVKVSEGAKDADGVTDYALDLTDEAKADIAKGVAAKDAVDNKGLTFAADNGTTGAKKLGDSLSVKGDANITTTAGANGIQVGLNKDLKVDSVKAGDTVVNNNGVKVGDKVALGKDGLKAGDVNITAEGINAGGKKVTGVAAGTVAAGSTDAVNGGQLHQVYELIGSNGGNVNTAPPSVEADGKAGLGNIKNITLVDNSNNPNVTNVTNETKIAQSNGYSLVTYNVEDQGMYVTNNVIEAVGRMNEQGIKFFHTNDGEVNPDVQARNSEDSSASGAYATAVGFQAASKGTNAIAIGKGAKANAENTIAIGTGNIVSGKNSGAIGDPTVVSGNSSYSIGNNNNVSADNAYALGSNIKATVNDSVYLGDRAQTQGIHTADAAKGEAYTYGGLNDKAVAGKAGSAAAANKVAGVVTVGNGTDETRQVQGVAAGVVSADSTDAINGSQLYYTNQAIANVATQATAAKTEVTAGKNVVVNQTTGNSGQTVYNVATADKLDVTSVTAGGVTVNAQGVSIAAPTAHNPANTVSLSPIGLNNGGQRITNVAPAKEGTDAVNLNQLAGVGNALQNNIERVGKKAYAGVAGAIAQGSIPQVTRPGATGIGVGSGYYGGQSAMAIGVSAMSDGGNWVVKGNFSANTDGHVGVGAGALYQW